MNCQRSLKLILIPNIKMTWWWCVYRGWGSSDRMNPEVPQFCLCKRSFWRLWRMIAEILVSVLLITSLVFQTREDFMARAPPALLVVPQLCARPPVPSFCLNDQRWSLWPMLEEEASNTSFFPPVLVLRVCCLRWPSDLLFIIHFYTSFNQSALFILNMLMFL